MYDNTVAKALCNSFEFLPSYQKDFHYNLSQLFNSLRLYAYSMFQPCQLMVTIEGQ